MYYANCVQKYKTRAQTQAETEINNTLLCATVPVQTRRRASLSRRFGLEPRPDRHYRARKVARVYLYISKDCVPTTRVSTSHIKLTDKTK